MAALSQFYNQSYRWYLNPKSGRYGPCEPAQRAVYRRQKDRFGPELVARHWHQTMAVLRRADKWAQHDADLERWQRMKRAIEHERQAA